MRSTPETTPRARDHIGVIRSMIPYILEFKERLILALVLLVLAKVSLVAVPWILKQIVDSVDPSETATLAVPALLLLAYGALRFGNSLFAELRDMVFVRVTQRAIRRIAHQVFRHLHQLSLAFHLERKTGGLSRDIERGTRGMSFLLSFMVFNVIPTFVEIFLVGVILLTLFDVWFALVALTSVVGYVTYTFLVTEWRMKFIRYKNEGDSRTNTQAIDSLLNYETVKYFGNEDYEARRYDASLATLEEASVRNQMSLSLLNTGQGLFIAVGLATLTGMAAQGVVEDRLSIGDLVMINSYLLQLFAPLGFLGFVYREIKNALADMERMFNVLEEPVAIADPPEAKALEVRTGAVAFEEVSFGYHPERQVLDRVSFQVPPGCKVAVVGASGAGKSTLVRLLFRFYDVTGGRITIDGQDIRSVTQASLRQAIGIVPQDTVLFNDTLYQNIAYAWPDAEPEAVYRAAQLADVHPFAQSLPEGYETRVGERGLKLSGGEKQRLAIARVILKNPPILIFDEATSALDSRSERSILDALREVASGHTTLAIAHRLSTVVDADQILVLEHGRLIESGTHSQLLAHEGRYHELWHLQQEQGTRDDDPSEAVVEA